MASQSNIFASKEPIDTSTPSATLITNPFAYMMEGRSSEGPCVKKDKCTRPAVTYTTNYDPYKPPSDTQPKGYSPYVSGEPLFDDRAVIIARLLPNHVLTPPPKRPRTQWVWQLGYALTDTSKAKPINKWCCKLCK